jgi:hypothetical protein
METLKEKDTKNNLVPALVAVFVPTFLTLIGIGFYHGAFHMNSNTTHCHNGACHKH